MRRRLLPLLLLGVSTLLAACAGDVNKPTAVQALHAAFELEQAPAEEEAVRG